MQVAQAVRKITHLIQRVPSRQRDHRSQRRLRNFHSHCESMFFGILEGNRVVDGRRDWPRQVRRDENQKQEKSSRESGHARAPACAANFSSNFPLKPSKLPLDIIITTSPGRDSAARYSAISSAESNACAGRPSARTSSATFAGEKRSSSFSNCARLTGPIKAASAKAKASGSTFSNTFRRMVFERGSIAAQMRRPGQRVRA